MSRKKDPFAKEKVWSANNTLTIAKGDIHVRMNDSMQFIMRYAILQVQEECRKSEQW